MAKFIKNNLGNFLVIFVLAILVSAGIFYYFTLYTKGAETKTIQILPTIYSGSWNNQETALVQDLGAEAGFEEFNEENSAYPVPVEAGNSKSEIRNPKQIQNSNDQIPETPEIEETIISESEPFQEEIVTSSEETIATESEELVPPIEEEILSPSEPLEEEQASPSESAQVSYILGVFLDLITSESEELMATESESLESAEEVLASEGEPIYVELVPIEDLVTISEEVATESEEVPNTTSEDLISEVEPPQVIEFAPGFVESVLEFSDFSIPPEFSGENSDGKEIKNIQLRMSLAFEGGGPQDVLVIEYSTVETKKSANPEKFTDVNNGARMTDSGNLNSETISSGLVPTLGIANPQILSNQKTTNNVVALENLNAVRDPDLSTYLNYSKPTDPVKYFPVDNSLINSGQEQKTVEVTGIEPADSWLTSQNPHRVTPTAISSYQITNNKSRFPFVLKAISGISKLSKLFSAKESVAAETEDINTENSSPEVEETWNLLAELYLSDSNSNATNGGYWLYALPSQILHGKTLEGEPIFWEDLGKLKIRFKYRGFLPASPAGGPDSMTPLSELNKPKGQVYLDALWLEVDYEKKVEELAAETLQKNAELKTRKLEKEIRLDNNSPFECGVEPFAIHLSEDSAQRTTVILRKKGKDNLLEIGNLPIGIDIRFVENNDYLLLMGDRNEAAIEIYSQVGSQKGNFSVPIIYQSGNSTTICQINLINF